MPEGDTIHKIAAAIRPDLEGHVLARLRMRERGEIAWATGRRVERIEVVGKHLLVGIEPDWVLRVHLGMHGRWHRYDPGERWRYPRDDAHVVIATEEDEFVCFRAARAELRRKSDLVLRHRLGRVGPDLLAPECDLDDIVRRARHHRHQDRAVTELLLDQSVASGIGNVYKSEVLFMCGAHPTTRVAAVDDAHLTELYRCARELLQRNVSSGRRATIPKPTIHNHFWVYRRRDQPCLRCKTPIARALHGDLQRSTYWCPTCQPESPT